MRKLSQSTSPVLGYGEFSSRKYLNECVYKNDIDGAKACLHYNKMAWNTRNESGLTPLMEASILSRLEMLNLLLSSKCDVNVTDENGNTYLHLAVDEGNMEVIRKLIESGNADPDSRDKTGQTALHIALREGSQMTVDLLMKHGCDVTVADNLGQSALYVAIHSSCNKTLDLAKKLISEGYDLSADKRWLLNDEKHNLFYQDDDFYATLRTTLRKHSTDVLQDLNTYRKITTSSNTIDTNYSITSSVISPKKRPPTTAPFPMSHSMKQNIMSSKAPKYPPVPFSQMPSNESSSAWLSPTYCRRNEFVESKSFEQVKPKPPLLSSDSDDSPIGAPALQHRRLPFDTRLNSKSDDTHVTPFVVSSAKNGQEVTKKDGRSVTASYPNKKQST